MITKQVETEQEYKAIDWKIIRRLLVFLNPYKIYVFISVLLTIIISGIAPLRPFLIKSGIDDYIAKHDSTGLLIIIFYIFGLLAGYAFLQFLLTYLMQWLGQKVLSDIRIKLFAHIHSLPFSFYDKTPVGRLVTRVTNDVEGLNEMFSSGVVMIVADILLIFWLIVFMFLTNWLLTLYLMLLLPVLFSVTLVFRKKVRIVFRDIRKNVATMNSYLNEFISGIMTVKAFTREKLQLSEFDTINLENKNLWIKTVLYYASYFPVIEMLSTLTIAIIIWYTAGNILSGLMTIGTLVAFLQYAEMFFRPIRDLTEKYTTMQSAMASAERIFGLLDTPAHDKNSQSDIHFDNLMNGIEFSNVSFSYDGDKPVLKNVSFKINRGETVAVVGATGAGKTTLINLLLGFYQPTDGKILVDGNNLKDVSPESFRAKTALVMQDVFLFSRTVGENISLGNDFITTGKVNEAAQALRAADFINALPQGYESQVLERGSNFSVGQKQLIAFSRALAVNPEILILDEATSNIDSGTEELIEKSLDTLLRGRTSLIIAHRISTIKRADKILVLHHGELRESGSHAGLIGKNGIYSRLYKLQYKTLNEIPAQS